MGSPLKHRTRVQSAHPGPEVGVGVVAEDPCLDVPCGMEREWCAASSSCGRTPRSSTAQTGFPHLRVDPGPCTVTPVTKLNGLKQNLMV